MLSINHQTPGPFPGHGSFRISITCDLTADGLFHQCGQTVGIKGIKKIGVGIPGQTFMGILTIGSQDQGTHIHGFYQRQTHCFDEGWKQQNRMGINFIQVSSRQMATEFQRGTLMRLALWQR